MHKIANHLVRHVYWWIASRKVISDTLVHEIFATLISRICQNREIKVSRKFAAMKIKCRFTKNQVTFSCDFCEALFRMISSPCSYKNMILKLC